MVASSLRWEIVEAADNFAEKKHMGGKVGVFVWLFFLKGKWWGRWENGFLRIYGQMEQESTRNDLFFGWEDDAT